jgi:hypothetical protein
MTRPTTNPRAAHALQAQRAKRRSPPGAGLRNAERVAPTAAYAADIRDEIGRVPADAVLSIDMILGAVLGEAAAGVPVAMLSPHVSLRPLPGVAPMFSDLAQPTTPEERAEVAAANDAR